MKEEDKELVSGKGGATSVTAMVGRDGDPIVRIVFQDGESFDIDCDDDADAAKRAAAIGVWMRSHETGAGQAGDRTTPEAAGGKTEREIDFVCDILAAASGNGMIGWLAASLVPVSVILSCVLARCASTGLTIFLFFVSPIILATPLAVLSGIATTCRRTGSATVLLKDMSVGFAALATACLWALSSLSGVLSLWIAGEPVSFLAAAGIGVILFSGGFRAATGRILLAVREMVDIRLPEKRENGLLNPVSMTLFLCACFLADAEHFLVKEESGMDALVAMAFVAVCGLWGMVGGLPLFPEARGERLSVAIRKSDHVIGFMMIGGIFILPFLVTPFVIEDGPFAVRAGLALAGAVIVPILYRAIFAAKAWERVAKALSGPARTVLALANRIVGKIRSTPMACPRANGRKGDRDSL